MPLIIIDLRSLSVAFNSVEVDWTLAGQPEEDFERHWLWQRTISSWRFQKIVCNNCDAARCQDMSRLHNRHVGQALWLDGPRSPPLNVRRKRWMSNGGLSHDVTDFRAPWQALYRGTTGSPLDPIAAIAILWCWLKFDRLIVLFLSRAKPWQPWPCRWRCPFTRCAMSLSIWTFSTRRRWVICEACSLSDWVSTLPSGTWNWFLVPQSWTIPLRRWARTIWRQDAAWRCWWRTLAPTFFMRWASKIALSAATCALRPGLRSLRILFPASKFLPEPSKTRSGEILSQHCSWP